MTISSTIAKHQYKGNGNTFIFPFSFRIWNKKQILVTITNSEGITNTIMPYAVTFTQKGGEVTLYLDNEKKIPFPKGYSIALTRNMPFLQESDYINGTRINSEVFEDNLDIATAERQQLLERVLSAITVPPTSSQTPDELWNDFISDVNFVKQALLAIQKAMANLFSQTIIPFTTKNNVLVYSVGEDIVLDPDANNLLLVMNNIVQQPDVAYFIKSNNTIQFKVNPGEGKKVWGISSLSFANPDIRAIVEKAIQKIVAEGNKQVTVVTNKGTEQIKFVQTEGTKQINYAKEQATLAKAWAESPTPPDPKDPHSKSAKEWAKEVSKGGILASPTEAGRVCYDNVTIKAKADGKSTLYTPLLSAVSPTNAINSVTSKAIADYAAGKNVDNKLMAWNQFEHVGIQVRNAYYEIGQPNLPERNTYASIYFVDKRGLLHGVDNSLGHLVNRVTNKGYQETYLDVIKNAGSEEPLLAYLKVGLSPTNIAYATAPSAPDDWIGDYIATTAWVNKNSQVMKRLATRNVSGDVTLTNLKINVPVYVVLEKWEQWFTHSILPKKGVINGIGSKLPFHLGGTAYLALLTMHNQALMFIPNATTAIFSVTMMQDPNALIGFYQ